jgi:hypothetical protein
LKFIPKALELFVGGNGDGDSGDNGSFVADIDGKGEPRLRAVTSGDWSKLD